jgi:hypothetical protein
MNRKTDVALLIWSLDVIEVMSLALLDRHLAAAGLEPAEDIQSMEEFIRSCDPSVVVFDLAPPYRRSARTAELLLRRFPSLPFVFTCADRRLAQMQESWLSSCPVLQKPYDVCAFSELLASMAKPVLQRPPKPETFFVGNSKRPASKRAGSIAYRPF